MKHELPNSKTFNLFVQFALLCVYARWFFIPLFMLGWFGVTMFFIGFCLLFGRMVRYALTISGIINTHVKILRKEH
ncbi:MAG: hypothetical protein O3B64_02135 [bacterium]|nr:hypothetical protein [bacterium]